MNFKLFFCCGDSMRKATIRGWNLFNNESLLRLSGMLVLMLIYALYCSDFILFTVLSKQFVATQRLIDKVRNMYNHCWYNTKVCIL